MPFLIMQGAFLPATGQPDGDSVRFTPDNPDVVAQLEQVAGRKVQKSDSGGRMSFQLRYEGIDAMEKNAKPDLPKKALDNNKRLLGYVQGSVREPRGYVLASGIEKNGRPIVFVYAGSPPAADGSEFFLDPGHLKKSVNFLQAEQGWVYPMYYQTLYAELRKVLTTAVQAARSAQLGVWALDRSNLGFDFRTRNQVSSLDPIFPKLYRRLEQTSATTVAAFRGALAAQMEELATLSDGRFLHFDDVVEDLGEGRLKMSYFPEDMVFK